MLETKDRCNLDYRNPDYHHMLGMRLDYMPVEAFLGRFLDIAQSGGSAYCCVPDVNQCVTCHDDRAHRAIVNGADFVFSDSTILQRARGIRHGVRAIRTILGSNLMLALCEGAESRNLSIGLIGGRDDDVLAKIVSALQAKYPGLEIAYRYSPPFRPLTDREEREMIEKLAASGAQLVFFGLGCPKQEQWMARYKDQINAAMIGVGAAFDTIGGVVGASPDFVHRNGLEWLYRLLREPRRLYRRYLLTAPRFVLLLASEWVTSALPGFRQRGFKNR